MIEVSILLTIIGSIILWDKLTIGEFGLSQPIVSCPLIGLCFGEFYTGLLLGGALQLVWVGSLPLGGKEPLDNQGAGVVAISSYILGKKLLFEVPQAKMVFISLLFAGIASIIGQAFSQILKKVNNRLFTRVNKNSSDTTIVTTHFTGLFTAFVRGLVLVVIFQALLIVISPLIKLLPNFNLGELLILPLIIGVAGIAHLVIFKRRILFSVFGIITGLFLWVLLK